MVRHKAQNVTAKPRTGDIQICEDTDFNCMFLPQPILDGLKKSGYIRPSPIQKKALPLVRCGLDLIVQAKAGTGKTCVFTVAVLELVKPSLPHLQAIVLAPTREIALQIAGVINAIGRCVKGLKVGCFIGGFPLSSDMEKVKGCQVAVAAPGRLKHLLDKGLLNPHRVRLLVLDEADKLMEKVFIKDINAIFAQLPESKQVLACSATYTEALVEFLSRYMNGGQYVSPEQTVSPTVLLGVRQFVSVIPKHVDRLAQLKLKEKHLLHLLRSVSFNQCLVFSNLHTRAVSLCSLLRVEGWGVEWIAGRQQQKDRVAALTQLRDQRVRVLVTTDLTARGIDVDNVNLVINLDLPIDHHTYLHRMGRAGRYGSHGIVITVVSDGQELTAFQKLIGMIGGTAQSANRIPQTLKNIDLWTMSDEKFEKICGVVETKAVTSTSVSEKEEDSSTSTAEKCSPESSSTSTAEKCSPESSDSEDYVKEYKGENGAPKSSDSEDYVKEYKGENGTGQSDDVVKAPGITFDMSRMSEAVNDLDTEKTGDVSTINTTVKSDKAEYSTSTDEKFSRDSSDDEMDADSCECGLYEADAADIKVIAGPSLFALKKEDHWREVLPVVVNESKVPLNTPIALLDSKLIRVRFWDKSERFNANIEVYAPKKEVINFDSEREDRKCLAYKDIVSFLENGIKVEDQITGSYDITDRHNLSFENTKETLESGFCGIGERTDFKSHEIEQILMKYKLIKKKSESALISFDSFDLVGWLAVDELHNIIEEINIDDCDVFLFKLVTCLAGKNHIEVLTPPKGSSVEAHDYIDHITTLNVESFSLTTPFSLSNIAQQIANCASNSSDKILRSNKVTQDKPSKQKLPQQTPIERHESDTSLGIKMKPLIDPLKVPIIVSDNQTKKSGRKNSSNEQVSKNEKTKNEDKCVPVGSLPSAKQQKMSPDFVNSNGSGHYVETTWKPKKDVQELDESHVPFIKNSSIPKSHKAKHKLHHQQESGSKDKNKHHNGLGQNQKHRDSDDSYDSFDSAEHETTDLDKELKEMLNDNETHGKHYTKHRDTMCKQQNQKFTKPKTVHSKQERSKSYKESRGAVLSIECEGAKSHPKLYPKVSTKREQTSKNKNLSEVKHKTLHNYNEESHDSYNPIETEISKLRELNSKLNHREKAKHKHHIGHRNKNVKKDSEEENSSVESGGTNRHSFRTACSQHDSEEEHDCIFGGYNSEEHDCLRDEHYEQHDCHGGGHYEQHDCHRGGHYEEHDCHRGGHYEQHDCHRGGHYEEHDCHGGGHYEEHDCHRGGHYEEHGLYGGISNRSSQLSNHGYKNKYGVPHGQFKPAQFSGRDESSYQHYHRNGGREERYPQVPAFAQHFCGHDPNGYYDYSQTEVPNEYFRKKTPQEDFSGPSRRGLPQTLTGQNLHQEWYSKWYMRVRQRAMQLGTMEYIKNMSTP